MKHRRSLILTAVIALLLAAVICWQIIGAHRPEGEVSYVSQEASNISPEISQTDVSPSDLFRPKEEKRPLCATVQLAGDVLIHQMVYTNAKTDHNNYDFSPFFSEFGNVLTADLSVVNLENPVDAYGGNSKLSSFPYFNCPREILPALKSLGVDVCTLSNNHAFDQKLDGVRSTISLARAEGIDTVGTYSFPEDTDELYIKDINGIKIGICAFTEHLNGVFVPDDAAFCTGMTGRDKKTDFDMMITRVNALREAGADFIILCYHWGEEYRTQPQKYQKETAQRLCDAGVDVLAGSHSHCVMPIEWITSTDGSHRMLTIYSLGNFFVYQNTNVGNNITRFGMVVSLKIKTDENGAAYIDNSFYMPTATLLTGGKNADFVRLYAAGQVPLDDKNGTKCAQAYDYVCKTVGSEIPAVKGPDSVPEGFFDVSETDVSQ